MREEVNKEMLGTAAKYGVSDNCMSACDYGHFNFDGSWAIRAVSGCKSNLLEILRWANGG